MRDEDLIDQYRQAHPRSTAFRDACQAADKAKRSRQFWATLIGAIAGVAVCAVISLFVWLPYGWDSFTVGVGTMALCMGTAHFVAFRKTRWTPWTACVTKDGDRFVGSARRWQIRHDGTATETVECHHEHTERDAALRCSADLVKEAQS